MTTGEKESTNLSLNKGVKAIANKLAKTRGQNLSEYFESLALADLARVRRHKVRSNRNEAARALEV